MMSLTTSPTLRRKRGVALEDAILDAAFAELTEVGLKGFTVEGVAARARTGQGEHLPALALQERPRPRRVV